jgi:tRNA threonylcarbamoyladenosine biosynthesis protein TsaE
MADLRSPDSGVGTDLPARVFTEVVTHSAEETTEFGRELAKHIQPPCLLLLEGELGSGKTTLVKGLVAGLGAAREEEVTSPSFTLVHEYGHERKVYHVDLFRIEGARDFASLGLDDLFEEDATVIIEWGERISDNAPGLQWRVRLEYVTSEERRITVESRHR